MGFQPARPLLPLILLRDLIPLPVLVGASFLLVKLAQILLPSVIGQLLPFALV